MDIDENTPREIESLDEWATSCGVQKAGGFQLTQTSQEGEPLDVGVLTVEDLPADSPVLYVPNEMILSSRQVQQELGSVEVAENLLDLLAKRTSSSNNAAGFYLMLKILTEYEQGDLSPWFPWLNSLPRYFSSGSSMTHFCCSECLPPLVGNLAGKERIRFIQFFQTLKFVPFLSEETRRNRNLAKWAFAVVYTRSFMSDDGDMRIVPMADMFNHGTDTEVAISHDEEGNYYAYSTYDVPAGYPLRMSYGDSTNPSHLFAKYGFLDESSPATFCKIMINNPSPKLLKMGYDHSRMLFYKDTGGVSEEVWDVLLYQILESYPDLQQQFYDAHVNGDYDTKQSMLRQYYPQTSEALINHIDTFLYQLEGLSAKAAGRDLNVHPRIPLIQKHNEFVKETFQAVREQL